jgi:hypothetical protein
MLDYPEEEVFDQAKKEKETAICLCFLVCCSGPCCTIENKLSVCLLLGPDNWKSPTPMEVSQMNSVFRSVFRLASSKSKEAGKEAGEDTEVDEQSGLSILLTSFKLR